MQLAVVLWFLYLREMPMKVIHLTLALPLLIGLVFTHNLAYASAYALSGPGEGRVVSRQTQTETGEQSTSDKETKEPSAGPMEVFTDIEKGWNAEKVNLILKHFGQGKVTISIEGAGPSGGEFSKSQSYYLLSDMFKYTITRKFEIVQYRKPEDSGNTSFIVAERYYQMMDDGRLFKDKIFVSLHREPGADQAVDDRWVVDEIKSIR
jgi:hypothetical protein